MSSRVSTFPSTPNSSVCRLCQVDYGESHKCISEANAEMDEVYKITVKYFPAKFLEPCWSNHPAALCLECWRHIIEFYSFQESIFEAQKNLLRREKEVDIDMKDTTVLHRNDCDIMSDNNGKGADQAKLNEKLKSDVSAENIYQNGANKTYQPTVFSDSVLRSNMEESEEEHIDISLSDLEDIDIQFSSDDETEVSTSLDTVKEVECKTPLASPTQTKSESSAPQVPPQTNDEEVQKLKKQTNDMDTFIAEYKPKLYCYICSKTATTFTLLQNHFRLNHSKAEFYIICCTRKFTNRLQLKDHLRDTHKQIQRLNQCKYCKLQFPRPSILKKHQLLKHRFVCPECPSVFFTSELLQKHYNAHFICEECNKEFKTMGGLKSHKLQVHIINKNKKFPTLTSPEDNSLKAAFTCAECGKTMNSKSTFDNHILYAHEDDIKYMCNICEKGFKKPLNFRDHINIHSSHNYYACPHCLYMFQYWAHLYSHMQLSHVEMCTPKHLEQLLLAEEAHAVIQNSTTAVKNGSSTTNGHMHTVTNGKRTGKKMRHRHRNKIQQTLI